MRRQHARRSGRERRSRLKVAHCGNVTCTAGNTLTTVDSEGFVGSIAIGADGLPVVSYEENDALKVAHCGNVTCTAGNTLTTVDSDVGGGGSIAIGADGLPVVSYGVGEFGPGLKVAHCGNVTCTAGNTLTTVDGFSPIVTCIAPGFLDSDLKVIISTQPRPGRRSRVALEPGCDSRTSPASTARCTSA